MHPRLDRLVVWGSGAKYRQLRSVCRDMQIRFLVDNDPCRQGCLLDDLEIHPPQRLLEEDPERLMVIVASSHVMEISGQLEGMGFQRGRHFMYANRFMEFGLSPFDASEETYLQTHLCLEPFRDFLLHETGDVYTCCQAYQDIPIGNLFNQPWDEIWSSPRATRFRDSLRMGTYEFCSRKCPFIARRRLAPKTIHGPMEAPSRYAFPKKIVLGCDETCNLHCPSCRPHIIVNKADQQRRIFEALDQKVRPMLSHADVLDGLSSGEFLLSPSVSSFLKTLNRRDHPHLRLWLTTNGQLLTPEQWKDFSNLQGMIERLSISLDATCKATYESLRRGGSWEKIRHNLAFAASLRQKGEFREFVLRFVVQKTNFIEMPRFVEMAQELGVDRIVFSAIVNWGAMTEAEFNEANVAAPDHPDHPRLRSILATPVFRNPPLLIDPDNMGRLFV